MDKLARVTNFLNTNEAYIAKGLLESEGIEAWVFDEQGAGYTPFVVGGVRLMVRRSDLENAINILALKGYSGE